MKSLTQTYEIAASVENVWDALVNPKTINAWGGGPAKMSAKSGASFTLWGGDIYGKNTDVVPNKLLVQEWLQRGWKTPSHVTFTLEEHGNKTNVTLHHSDIPDADFDDIADGWKEYYLGPMKNLLEE